MYSNGLKNHPVKLNESNYKYSNPENASKGRSMKDPDQAYSALANPKGRTLPMAGYKGMGPKGY